MRKQCEFIEKAKIMKASKNTKIEMASSVVRIVVCKMCYRKVANSSRPLIVAAPLVSYLNLLSKNGSKNHSKLIVAAATISDFTVL